MHIVNPPRRNKSAYPIATFTYAIVPTNAPQGGLLQSFIGYALGAGQRFGPSLDFAPIPKVVLQRRSPDTQQRQLTRAAQATPVGPAASRPGPPAPSGVDAVRQFLGGAAAIVRNLR